MSIQLVVFVVLMVVGTFAWVVAAIKNRSAMMALMAAAGIGALVFSQDGGMGSAKAVLVWAGSAAALAPISSVVMQVIRQFEPGIEGKTAQVFSALVAFTITMVARVLLPLVPTIPAWFDSEVLFGLAWITQQLWYSWGSEKAMPALYVGVP